MRRYRFAWEKRPERHGWNVWTLTLTDTQRRMSYQVSYAGVDEMPRDLHAHELREARRTLRERAALPWPSR
jgi:hypothetical protein